MTKRTRGGQFAKGQSGNPGGRPAMLAEVQELARTHTADCLTRLIDIAKNEKSPAQARVAANVAVLDRAWGKPGQAIDMNVTKNDVDDLLESIDGKTRGIPTRPIQ